MLILLMAVMGSVSASKSRFKDPRYDFKNITTVYLADAVYNPDNKKWKDFTDDSDPVKRTVNALRTAMAKKNKYLIVPPDEAGRTKLELSLAVHCLGTVRYWKEPWTEEKYVDEKITKKDKDGKEKTWTIPVKRVIHHPGQWITNAFAEVEFTLKDRGTGRTVYNCRDDRARDESDYDGMLKRITGDFVNDLK